MRISLSGQLTLKDRPRDYLGITEQRFSIGKDEVASYAEMVLSFVVEAAAFYGLLYSAKELNAELDEIQNTLQCLVFTDDEEAPCDKT